MKILKSLIVAFIALFASTNFVSAQTTATVQTAENIKTLTVKVKGVGCSNDCKTICTNVEKLEGVNSCSTVKKGAITTFEAKYDPAVISEEEIHAAIENTGGCTNPDSRPYKVKE